MNAIYRDYMMAQLEKLMAIDSPSGFTHNVQACLMEELKALGYAPQANVKGGVVCDLGGEGDGVMFFAHVDTLGGVVNYIKPNGRLAISRVGGLNPNNVETENVRVYSRFNGLYDGTVQVPNPSVHVNADVNKARSFENNLEVVLDELVSSADGVRALGISAGDFIAFDPRYTVTGKGYIKSRFLDDKASAAVLLAYAKYLKDEKVALKRKVVISFTVYEEVGHGACCGVPDGIKDAISVDMGCVGEGVTCDETMVSICAKDSGGPYNYQLTTELVSAAKEAGVDYAVDVYNFYGSDVEAALRAGYDFRHGLIGPGVFASHGYERTHIKGLENTFKLIKAYIG